MLQDANDADDCSRLKDASAMQAGSGSGSWSRQGNVSSADRRLSDLAPFLQCYAEVMLQALAKSPPDKLWTPQELEE